MSKVKNVLPNIIQDFLTEHLIKEKGFSTTSMYSYRDGIKLLLSYGQEYYGKSPSEITFNNLNTKFVIDFLMYLEKDRDNSVNSRNQRLAIIKTLVKYISYRHPDFIGTAQEIKSNQFQRKKASQKYLVILLKMN